MLNSSPCYDLSPLNFLFIEATIKIFRIQERFGLVEGTHPLRNPFLCNNEGASDRDNDTSGDA
jgi:hypothetical protein